MADRKQGAGWSSGSSAAGHKAHWYGCTDCLRDSRCHSLSKIYLLPRQRSTCIVKAPHRTAHYHIKAYPLKTEIFLTR